MSAGQDHAVRVGHMLRVHGYLSTAIVSMWSSNPRSGSLLGMAEASLRDGGPRSGDEEVLERLRALILEAGEYYEAGDFPATMARMRVAHDLSSLRIIELAGE